MKNITLLLLLFSSLLFAKSGIYLGAGYAHNTERVTYKSLDETISNNAANIKIGYGDRKAYAVEFSLNYVDNKSNIFDTNDGKKYGFDIALLKAWDFGIYIYPYLKAGFGAGYLETPADLHNNSLTYGSFNLGIGFFLPLSDAIDIEVAYEHKNVSYQKPDQTINENPISSIHIVYTGLNFRF